MRNRIRTKDAALLCSASSNIVTKAHNSREKAANGLVYSLVFSNKKEDSITPYEKGVMNAIKEWRAKR